MPEAPAQVPPVDVALVERLIAGQFPRWAHLPVRPVEFGGNDNRTFHLGDGMSVRLPSAEGYAGQAVKEHRWLPKLAGRLPLPVPALLAKGRPAEGYPFGWSVLPWIEGETASAARISDLTGFATALARFLAALQRIDPAGGPAPGRHCGFRGAPLATYDAETRDAIGTLGDRIDGETATAVWETALRATWHGRPVWFHGDVAEGNLLVRDGRLAAVIDFGCSGVGDPACDVTIAWTLLHGESRRAFREALAVDRATWARGRGWTLWKALITLAADDPVHSASARRTLGRVLEEYEQDA